MQVGFEMNDRALKQKVPVRSRQLVGSKVADSGIKMGSFVVVGDVVVNIVVHEVEIQLSHRALKGKVAVQLRQ